MTNKTDNLASRPPVVVVMGHIDHGKSKLLDYIRKANVVEKEKGGITQHVGAYEVETKNRRITFLDTPGHEAFSKIRSRGARAADIAILVVAAEEGVKPQTMEAYKAIEKTNTPFVVAINKIDKPEANTEQVKGQLAENQIFVESYGGKVPSVNISAKTGQGVDELLDMILLMADLENLKADSNENASGVVIESHLEPKRGISATLLILNGAVKKGQFIVSGSAQGGAIAPVRIFEDFKGGALEKATFSSPIKIVGFNNLPQVGAEFKTYDSKKEAEEKVAGFIPKEIKLETLITEEENKTIIPIIIKADMSGSVEAVEKEIRKLESEDIILNILRKEVGIISEDDAKLVSGATKPVILGFNVSVDPSAQDIMERTNVKVYTSDIIYRLSEWLKDEIEKRKALIFKEEITGVAKILKTFSITRNKQVVGGQVLEGKIILNGNVKIKRNSFAIGEGKITNLQHNKIEVSEVNKGDMFGIIIESKIEILKGDEIEIVTKK
ncbi:MAG: translation initiation factor IF-2 [Candidatus Paceibacterota bacterium]